MADPFIKRQPFRWNIQYQVLKDSLNKHKETYLELWQSLVLSYVQYLSTPLKSQLPTGYAERGVGKEKEEVDPDIMRHIPRDVINYYGYEIMKKLTLPRSALKRLPVKISDEILEFMTQDLVRFFAKIPKTKRKEKLKLDAIDGFELEIQDRDGFRIPFHSLDEMIQSILLQIYDKSYRVQWLRTLDRIGTELVPNGFLHTVSKRNQETQLYHVITTWVPYYSTGNGYDLLFDAITQAIQDVNAYVSHPTTEGLITLYTNLANTLVRNPVTNQVKDDMAELILSEVEVVEQDLKEKFDYIPPNNNVFVNRFQFPLLPFHTVLGIVSISIRLLFEKTYGQGWMDRLYELQQQVQTESTTSAQFFSKREFMAIKQANSLGNRDNMWYVEKETHPREFRRLVTYLLQGGNTSLARLLCRQIVKVEFLKDSLRQEATHLFFYENPRQTGDVKGICAANLHQSDGTPERREARFKDAKNPVWIMTLLLFCTSESGGVGHLLMSQIKEYAKEQEVNYIYLASLAHVIGFYRNEGFQNSRNLRGEETKNTQELWAKVQALGCRQWTEQNVILVPQYVEFLKFLIQNNLAHGDNNCQSIEECNPEGYDMQLVLKPWKERGMLKLP